MSRRALIVCPGRGSYRADNLGSLTDRSPDAAAVVAEADAYRTSLGRPTVSDLDGAERFKPSVHLAGEHASLLTFTAGLADLAELHADYEVVGVTGNSMGWYTALAASGALPLEDAMRLVETMASYQAEGVVGGQLLYPLTGGDWRPDPARLAAVETALATVRAEGHGAWWSIRLGSYAVLGATEAGLAALAGALPAETRGARSFPLRLPRHAAFHTPLLAGTSRRARRDLADLRFAAPAVPLIDGRGFVFRPRWADPLAMADWTLGPQVTHTYDFTAALHTALHHTAPDVVVLLGPGNSLGAPSAAVVVQTDWWGLGTRAALDTRQSRDPVLLSFGVPEQAQRLRDPGAAPVSRWTGRTALVTGASAGIGRAVARRLAREGMRVALVARRADRLQALVDELPDALAVPLDLRDADAIPGAFDTVEAALGGVDVLVNSAGLGHLNPLVSGDTEPWREMLEVNVLALAVATREAVSRMRARDIDDGHVLHLSSLSAHRVPDGSGMYAATKYAVRALTEGLRKELHGLGSQIRVTSISPGFVQTEFAAIYHRSEAKAAETYGAYQVLADDDVADCVWFALQAPPHMVVHDLLVRPTGQGT